MHLLGGHSPRTTREWSPYPSLFWELGHTWEVEVSTRGSAFVCLPVPLRQGLILVLPSLDLTL